jgi:tRNA (cmo5U34)-methyltransferase
MNVGEIFDAAAGGYDAARPRLVPCFRPFYAAAVEALPFPEDRPLRILDLGAGTGLLSALFAVRYPIASFVLVDVAEAMLAKAEERFAGRPGRASTMVMDYTRGLPPGPFDAVVSALSIHHIADDDKRTLFRNVREALVPGGVFINAEHVLGETAEQERAWDEAWERRARELGSGDAEIAAARERMTQDQCAPLSKQLRWLRDAGFDDVANPFHEGRFAVMTGKKPG